MVEIWLKYGLLPDILKEFERKCSQVVVSCDNGLAYFHQMESQAKALFERYRDHQHTHLHTDIINKYINGLPQNA